jgi:endonuclease I
MDTHDTAPDSGDTGEPPPPCFDHEGFSAEDACDELSAIWDGAWYDGIEPDSASFRADLRALLSTARLVSYDALWSAFRRTDARPDGTVWDIYSNEVFEFGDDQCGEYAGLGDCYNREHTWPQSWTDDDGTPRKDLHQVFPTDGYTNGRRGDEIYAEVASARWSSSNGSTLGTCTQDGRRLTAFEPDEEYKGDLARAYFYVSVRYRGEDASWNANAMVDGASIEPEAEAMLRRWAVEDPVSEKELDRNDAVQAIQGSRNPFIDHPEWMCWIDDF